jgi:hypothetical protein
MTWATPHQSAFLAERRTYVSYCNRLEGIHPLARNRDEDIFHFFDRPSNLLIWLLQFSGKQKKKQNINEQHDGYREDARRHLHSRQLE